MVLKSVHTTPMLNSTSFKTLQEFHSTPRVLGHGSLALTSAFVFEAFIAHLINLFSGTRGLPKQMVEKLGVSQTYRVLVSQKCTCVFIACYFSLYSLDDLLTRLTLKE